jgi:hypothetical protein
MLLEQGTKRADEAGLDMYLQASPEGARLYKKFGFEEKQYEDVEASTFGVFERRVRYRPRLVQDTGKGAICKPGDEDTCPVGRTPNTYVRVLEFQSCETDRNGRCRSTPWRTRQSAEQPLLLTSLSHPAAPISAHQLDPVPRVI